MNFTIEAEVFAYPEPKIKWINTFKKYNDHTYDVFIDLYDPNIARYINIIHNNTNYKLKVSIILS